MAKIASSKLYGSGKRNTPTRPKNEIEIKENSSVNESQPSPIRTSPRRRKLNSEETIETTSLELKNKKRDKPIPPLYAEKVEIRSEKKKNDRRKSGNLIEFTESESVLETTFKYDSDIKRSINSSNSKSRSRNEFKLKNSLNNFLIEAESSNNDMMVEDYVESVREEEIKADHLIYETNEQVQENNNFDIDGYLNYEEDNGEVETTLSDEELAFHFGSDQEEEIVEYEGYEEYDENGTDYSGTNYNDTDYNGTNYNDTYYNGTNYNETDYNGTNDNGTNDNEINDFNVNSQYPSIKFNYNTSNSVKTRLSEYFQRQESTRSHLWNRMKNWISERVIPGAVELGEATIEITKKAIEQISRRLVESRTSSKNNTNEIEIEASNIVHQFNDESMSQGIYNEDNHQIIVEEGYHANNQELEFEEPMTMDNENENVNIINIVDKEEHEIKKNEMIISKESSYYNVNEPLINEQFNNYNYQNIERSDTKSHSKSSTMSQFKSRSSTSNFINSDILDSRLTELVLFFAKCTRETPLPSIYENLQEFFMLKGEHVLNYTEKQLVSTVIKEYLTESDDEGIVKEHSIIPEYKPMTIIKDGQENENHFFSVDINNNKKIKVFPAGGIRFKAPKFTIEEEARLEELEKLRQEQEQQQQQQLKISNKFSKTSTPLKIRSKKLMTLQETAKIIESIDVTPVRPNYRVRGKDKEDSVSSAIEDIIAQKIKESKKREEAERQETENLKARVAELERETRDRGTKEILLQKQLEEQKKELEMEKEWGRAKIASLKTEQTGAINKESVGTGKISFGNMSMGDINNPFSKPTTTTATAENKLTTSLAPTFNFGTGKGNIEEISSAAIFKFGAKDKEEEKQAKPEFENKDKASGFTSPFASFSFGGGKKDSDKGSDGLIDGTKPSSISDKPEIMTEGKPETKAEFKSSGFGFSFGSTDKNAIPTTTTNLFNFGTSDKKVTETSTSSSNLFNFGASSSLKEEELKPVVVPNFNNGGDDGGKSKRTFSGVDRGVSGSKLGFDTGTSTSTSASTGTSNSGFGFGSLSSTSAPAPVTSNSKPLFNFGVPSATTATNSFNVSAAEIKNPFAGLSSVPNIFSNGSVGFNSSFSFNSGTPQPLPNANLFKFPPIQTNPSQQGQTNNPFNFPSMNSNEMMAAPIIPMNFGSTGNGNQQSTDESSEFGFQTGHRAISVPKRRRPLPK